VAIPIALLVLTVGAGLLGRLTERAEEEPAQPRVAQSTPLPDRPAVTPRPTPSLVEVPATAFRLPVRTVPDLIADLEGDTLPLGLLAVAGNLSMNPRMPRCDRPASLGDHLCERSGHIAASDRPTSATFGSAVNPPPDRRVAAISSLEVRVPVGTRLPTAVIFASAVADAERPKAAIVVGRFEATRTNDCEVPRSRCAPALVVERIAWLAGEWIESGVVRSSTIPVDELAGQGPATRTIALREVDRGEPILGRALLTLDDLARVDPAAARAIAGSAAGPIWYIRSVARAAAPGGPRSVTWTVIDHATGLLLAQGRK
jgi:hypothetical protein